MVSSASTVIDALAAMALWTTYSCTRGRPAIEASLGLGRRYAVDGELLRAMSRARSRASRTIRERKSEHVSGKAPRRTEGEALHV